MAVRLRFVPPDGTQSWQHVSDSYAACGSWVAKDILGNHHYSNRPTAAASVPFDSDRTQTGKAARSQPRARCANEANAVAATNGGKFVKGTRDMPRRLLAFAVRRMPSVRSDWGAAMLAEFDSSRNFAPAGRLRSIAHGSPRSRLETEVSCKQ